MAKKEKDVESQSQALTPEKQLGGYLKENKADHYNKVATTDYTVSTGSLAFDIETGGGLKPGIFRMTGVSEGGKEQPVWAKVLTPQGWRKIGELKEGDVVYGEDGLEKEVFGIFPQGVKPSFKITFDDGTFSYCGDEHLWKVVHHYGKPRRKISSLKTLKEIREKYHNTQGAMYSVDYCSPIKFEKQDLELHPYLLGVLLGDGCFSKKASHIMLSAYDDFVLDKCAKLLPDGDFRIQNKNKPEKKDFRFTGVLVKQFIDAYGLYGKLSYEKHVPTKYLYSSIQDRIHLLQGLMDTDGTIDKNKKWNAEFSTSSERLKDAMVELVRGLGGACWFVSRMPKFTYKGEKKTGRLNYRVYVSFSNGINPFSLPRKAELFKQRERYTAKYIKNIELIGNYESVCISVKDNLYITDDYTVTHNTSATLAIMNNFLKTIPNARGFYVKSEGRLGDEIQKRSGVTFVTDESEWKEGTCFVYKCNIYESVSNLIRTLMVDNPTNTKYFFVIDSMDSLVPRGDMGKAFDIANKVAGAALLTADFLRKTAITFSSYGHMCVLISQVRSTVSVNPYDKGDPKLTNATGGNAALHYSDWIFEFQPRFNKDIIWEGEEGKSNRLGHLCNIIFKKTPNEKTGKRVKYPIKYGRVGGKSNWIEIEVCNLLIDWQMFEKSGSWLVANQEWVKELKKKGFDIIDKVQGIKNLQEYLEANEPLLNYLYERFKSTLKKDEPFNVEEGDLTQ